MFGAFKTFSFFGVTFWNQVNQMKTISTLALVMLTIFSNSAYSANFGKIRQVETVSIISLIANPEKYDGRPVRVNGAIRLEFEAKALCLHQEDVIQRIYMNCLWIQPDLNALAVDEGTLSALNNQYVILEGTFRKDEHGHRGLYSAAITGIWRVLSLEQMAK
jgi:hypothetical protein